VILLCIGAVACQVFHVWMLMKLRTGTLVVGWNVLLACRRCIGAMFRTSGMKFRTDSFCLRSLLYYIAVILYCDPTSTSTVHWRRGLLTSSVPRLDADEIADGQRRAPLPVLLGAQSIQSRSQSFRSENVIFLVFS
jgi:hypothetical protein